jgi:hypothetical protein
LNQSDSRLRAGRWRPRPAGDKCLDS